MVNDPVFKEGKTKKAIKAEPDGAMLLPGHRPGRATALTQAGMAREARGYEDKLCRLCGDWSNVVHLYPQYEARSLHASYPP